MNTPRRFLLGVYLVLAIFTLQGCQSIKGGTQRVFRRPTVHGKARELKMATKEELASRIAYLYNYLKSFQATVDLTPATGSVYKGEIKEYRDIRGYILFRSPMDLRVIGQYPVVRTTLFDMVSNGKDFKVLLASRNKFIVGDNTSPATSANSLENLRPSVFLQTMLIRPVNASQEKMALMDFTDEDNAQYILLIMGTDAQRNPILLRSVWFEREFLTIVRQVEYEPNSNIASDTRYSKWMDYGGIWYPNRIDINRPTDGFGVVVDVTKMEINKEMTDNQFVLVQPPGTTLQTIGAESTNVTPSPAKGVGQK